jgi:hypothetical protein
MKTLKPFIETTSWKERYPDFNLMTGTGSLLLGRRAVLVGGMATPFFW